MKNLKQQSNQSGFTIIEVLIVLAVAGIIMAIIFLAVPALERNQRNTQRRSDAAHLTGLVNEYESNNSGSLPTSITNTGPGGAGILDISKEHFSFMTVSTTINDTASTATTGAYPTDSKTLFLDEDTSCDSTSGTTGYSAGAFAVTYNVETSTSTQKACDGG